MSGIVHRPPREHECHPPAGPLDHRSHPAGTVWACECATTWVSRGLTGGGAQRRGGYAAAALEWRRESHRARRRRELAETGP